MTGESGEIEKNAPDVADSKSREAGYEILINAFPVFVNKWHYNWREGGRVLEHYESGMILQSKQARVELNGNISSLLNGRSALPANRLTLDEATPDSSILCAASTTMEPVLNWTSGCRSAQ